MIPWGLQPEPFLVAAGRKVEIVSCWLPPPPPPFHGCQAPTPAAAGGGWMSGCPAQRASVGQRRWMHTRFPPEQGQIHFLLGF